MYLLRRGAGKVRSRNWSFIWKAVEFLYSVWGYICLPKQFAWKINFILKMMAKRTAILALAMGEYLTINIAASHLSSNFCRPFTLFERLTLTDSWSKKVWFRKWLHFAFYWTVAGTLWLSQCSTIEAAGRPTKPNDSLTRCHQDVEMGMCSSTDIQDCNGECTAYHNYRSGACDKCGKCMCRPTRAPVC